MKQILYKIAMLPRQIKRLIMMLADAIVVPILLWCMLALRYDTLNPPFLPTIPYAFIWLSLFCVSIFYAFGIYRTVVRAFDEKFLQDVVWAVSTIVIVLISAATLNLLPSLPRSATIGFGFLVFLWLWGSRSIIRYMVRLIS